MGWWLMLVDAWDHWLNPGWATWGCGSGSRDCPWGTGPKKGISPDSLSGSMKHGLACHMSDTCSWHVGLCSSYPLGSTTEKWHPMESQWSFGSENRVPQNSNGWSSFSPLNLPICIYIYIHIYIYTYTYIYIHTCIHTYIHTHTYISIYTYIYTRICIYIRIYIYPHIHTYIHTHTYIYIYTYIYTYIYIYILYIHYLHFFDVSLMIWGPKVATGADSRRWPQNSSLRAVRRGTTLPLGSWWWLIGTMAIPLWIIELVW